MSHRNYLIVKRYDIVTLKSQKNIVGEGDIIYTVSWRIFCIICHESC